MNIPLPRKCSPVSHTSVPFLVLISSIDFSSPLPHLLSPSLESPSSSFLPLNVLPIPSFIPLLRLPFPRSLSHLFFPLSLPSTALLLPLPLHSPSSLTSFHCFSLILLSPSLISIPHSLRFSLSFIDPFSSLPASYNPPFYCLYFVPSSPPPHSPFSVSPHFTLLSLPLQFLPSSL